MTLKELQYWSRWQIKTLCRAARPSVGQPTLSTQLKKLEIISASTLFERNKHYLLPTPIARNRRTSENRARRPWSRSGISRARDNPMKGIAPRVIPRSPLPGPHCCRDCVPIRMQLFLRET